MSSCFFQFQNPNNLTIIQLFLLGYGPEHENYLFKQKLEAQAAWSHPFFQCWVFISWKKAKTVNKEGLMKLTCEQTHAVSQNTKILRNVSQKMKIQVFSFNIYYAFMLFQMFFRGNS